MERAQKERAIQTYFNMWIQRNFDGLEEIFAPDAYYSECYGPEYRGISEMRQWIAAMLDEQRVLEWSIQRILHAQDAVVVKWFFRDQVDETPRSFDGVSIIDFCPDGKIVSIREFGSKAEHSAPYR